MLATLAGDLSPTLFLFFVVLAGITSAITACFGAGGGLILLGVMTQFLPAQLVLPLHGVIQLGSNANRAAMRWRYIQFAFIRSFVPGAILGALLGSLVLVALPEAILYLSIGGFTLYTVWAPRLPGVMLGSWGISAMALATSFLTLFVGATGPLVAGFVKQLNYGKLGVVATFSAAMSIQHVVKIAVFHHHGVDLGYWLGFLVAMIAAGAVGTWLGLKFLGTMSEKRFNGIFNTVLTILALRMIYQGIVNW